LHDFCDENLLILLCTKSWSSCGLCKSSLCVMILRLLLTLVVCDGNQTPIWSDETFNMHEKLLLSIYVRYLPLVFSFILDAKHVVININLVYLKYSNFYLFL
jgi:hypothetical protein